MKPGKKNQIDQIERQVQEHLPAEDYKVPVGDGQENLLALLFNPARRAEKRARAGLPDDGKVWCASCRQSHLPPTH